MEGGPHDHEGCRTLGWGDGRDQGGLKEDSIFLFMRIFYQIDSFLCLSFWTSVIMIGWKFFWNSQFLSQSNWLSPILLHFTCKVRVQVKCGHKFFLKSRVWEVHILPTYDLIFSMSKANIMSILKNSVLQNEFLTKVIL